uniref:Uncharacterized protein n=1 Tax=Anguilla anguilla TaxID=7936 RepID=A0A0E9PZ77_ANGAN
MVLELRQLSKPGVILFSPQAHAHTVARLVNKFLVHLAFCWRFIT